MNGKENILMNVEQKKKALLPRKNLLINKSEIFYVKNTKMYPKFVVRPLKMLQWCYIVSMWRERGEGELLLGLPHALTSLHTFPHAVRSATEDCSQDATVTSPR